MEAGCVSDLYRPEKERKDDSRRESPVSVLQREQMKRLYILKPVCQALIHGGCFCSLGCLSLTVMIDVRAAF